MITPKFMMFCVLLMVAGLIISMGISGDFYSPTDWDSISQDLTGFDVAQFSGIGAIPIAFSGFITNGFPRMITWNYAFFQSDIAGLDILLIIMRAVCIMVFSVGLIYGIVSQFQSYMIPALIGGGVLWGIGSLIS